MYFSYYYSATKICAASLVFAPVHQIINVTFMLENHMQNKDLKYHAILGFNAFAGCDQTGNFYGFPKLSCWKVFINSPHTAKEAFTELGADDILLAGATIIGLTPFVLDLYCFI